MSYTKEQYEELKAAIASGASSIGYGDKKIGYRSLTEMKNILADMEAELFGKRPKRVGFIGVDNGYNKKG